MFKFTVDQLESLVCVSTAHITRDDRDLLDDHVTLMIYEKEDYGYFVRVPSNLEEIDLSEYSQAFRDLLAAADVAGCSWLEIDRDGDVIDGLPAFEW